MPRHDVFTDRQPFTMKKNKISINDIATQLGISKTTVSFILNGKAKEKRISDQLVQSVLKFVDEVGYIPNQFAQSLRTGKTRILGLMVEDISNPFFATIAKHIEDKAYEHGCKIIYCSTENSKKRAREFLKMFHNLGVDGYIITPPSGIEEDIQALVNQDAQIILFDRYFANIPTGFVMVDNEGGTYDGTSHLVAQGYRNIAFITLASEQPQMQGRLRGYLRATEEYGLQEHVHFIPFHKDYDILVDRVKEYLAQENGLDAILFGANYLGVRGLEAINKMGKKIPHDLAVVSFDDNDLFRVSTPSITAISQPIEKISEQIITTLLERIALGEPPVGTEPTGVFLPTQLLIRDSSARKA